MQIVKDVEYDRTIYRAAEFVSDLKYYKMAFDMEPSKRNAVENGFMPNFHITGNDIILIKGISGYKQIVEFHDGAPNILKPCFFGWMMDEFGVMHLDYARNDFDNGVLLFDMDTHLFSVSR